MTKQIFFFLIFCLFGPGFYNPAAGQSFQWGYSAGDWVPDFANATIFDQQGNVYVTGHGNGSLSFGPYVNDGWGFFLAKFDKSGVILWARFGNKSYNGQGRGLAVDSQGNVYVSGNFTHTLDLGDTVLHGTNQTNGFLAKYSSSGELLWANNLGNNSSSTWDDGGYVVVDKDDYVYVSGTFAYDIHFENGIVLTDNYPHIWPDREIYLVKFNKDGQIQWGKSAGSFDDDRVAALELGPSGEIYIAIDTQSDEFTFDGKKIPIPSNASLVLVITTEGETIWSTTMNGSATDISLDENGNLYVGGNFYEEIAFEETFPLFSESYYGVFLVKYLPNKSIAWSTEIESDGTWPVVIAALNEEVYLASTFRQNVQGNTLAAQSSSHDLDIFIAKYNEAGHEQWIRQISSNGGNDVINSLDANKEKGIVLAGEYTGPEFHLDGIFLKNNSGNRDPDIFIGKMDDPVPNKCLSLNPSLLVEQEEICPGEIATLSVEGVSGQSIRWYKDDQPLMHSFENQFEVSEPGKYYFVVYAESTCAVTSNHVFVKAIGLPEIKLQVTPANETCNNTPIQIEAEKNSDYTYQWYRNGRLIDGQHTYLLTASESGAYHAVLLNKGRCGTASEQVSIKILPEEMDYLPDTVYKCPNETVNISTDRLNSDEWNFSWSTNETTPAIEVSEEGIYTLSLEEGACYYEDQVVVKNYDELWVPNVITPNGDGLNDFFIVKKNGQSIHIVISNRWGKIVYESDNYLNSWSGEGLDSGTYYFRIRDKAGCLNQHLIKGWVQIIR